MQRIAMALGVTVGLWIALLLALHVSQKRYSVLDFEPEIPDAVAGEVLARALIAVMSHELHSYSGWRPNDFFLWGPTLFADDKASRQLGVILVVRETARVFKDHLTKVSSDEYDPNLVLADTMFRNDAERLWIPSAEGRFTKGIEALAAYVAGLHRTPPTSKLLNRRNVELIRLFQSWSDILGDAHASLYRVDVGFFRTDDLFYHAQGVAHAMGQLLRALHAEYRNDFQGRPILDTLIDEATQALLQASTLEPLVVLDGEPASVFANHRRNLDAYVNEARQKMYSIREELEK